MFTWLTEIITFKQNFICGGIGATLVAIYQLYQMLPDISADIFRVKNNQETRFFIPITLLILKIAISIFGGAIVTALLIRPEETYGALLSGMTWTTIMKNLIEGGEKNA